MPYYTLFRESDGSSTLTIQAPEWSVRIIDYGTDEAHAEVRPASDNPEASAAFVENLQRFIPAAVLLDPDTLIHAICDIHSNS